MGDLRRLRGTITYKIKFDDDVSQTCIPLEWIVGPKSGAASQQTKTVSTKTENLNPESPTQTVGEMASAVFTGADKKLTKKTVNLERESTPRSHHRWVLDSQRSSCAKCKENFTFTKRKHHCRECGDIFCSTC